VSVQAPPDYGAPDGSSRERSSARFPTRLSVIMLLIGFAGVAASQAALAATFLLPENTTRSYVILACMVLFVAFVQMFIGTVVWLLLSEIFPLSVRGFAMGIAVFVLWCTNAIISFVFPLLNNALGSTGTFALFVLVNIGSWIFVHRLVPETKGTSLEELEERLEAEGNDTLTERTPV
jgi:MFS transporter, SP family, major inositol transporter